MGMFVYFIVFLITLSVLILLHEAGHAWVARCFGVRVLRFSLGFGRPFFRWRRGETEYVLAPVLLGGYVKLLDEREGWVAEGDLPHAFTRKPVWQRISIVLAGPVTNLLLAIVVFWLMFAIGVRTPKPIIGSVVPASIAARAGLRVGDEFIRMNGYATPSWQQVNLALVLRLGEAWKMTGEVQPDLGAQRGVTVRPFTMDLATWRVDALRPDLLRGLGIEPYHPPVPSVVGKVQARGPAAKAGMRAGDHIVTIDGRAVSQWEDVTDYVKTRPRQRVRLQVERSGHMRSISVTTGRRIGAGWRWEGYLGVQSLPTQWPPERLRELRYPPLQALGHAVQETTTFGLFNFIILGKMLRGEISLQTLGGPISIFKTAGLAWRQGAAVYLGFLGLISVMLAFVNVLPIPGLDGGHILFLLIEAVRRRPLSARVELFALRLGVIFLVVLIAQATINDLWRLGP